jgi:NADPH-dependent glutamate synthase beta subunit-like oxidoreductase
MQQIGFFYDQTRCIECFACCVACKDWHDIPAGPAHWKRIIAIEEGKWPHLSLAHLAINCFHCAEPVCMSVCPAKAITKREEDGVMVVDRNKCQEEAHCGIMTRESLALFAGGEIQAPCKLACPAHLDVQGYVALIANGRYKEALDLIREKMPLPSVCGRVCKAPCETECQRQKLDEPVAISALKRFVTDFAPYEAPQPLPRTKAEKVAIIGSGPAGLSAAYDLVRMGYGVTVFEALPVAGGMLAVGVPQYRLPKEVLQRDIDYIKGLGVEIKLNTPVGDGLSFGDLRQQGYDAIFIATGAHKGQGLAVPGADLDGVLVGTSFLQDVNLGKKVKVGERVLVVGGGHVAVDCARSAWRLGAQEVQMACLECREEMPATGPELEATAAEGIVLRPSVTVTKVLSNRGKVAGVECLNLSHMGFDDEGQLHMDVIPGTEHTVAADTVIWAIGQAVDLGFLDGCGIRVSNRGSILVDPDTFETNIEGIFAGGDVIGGQEASVIHCIAAGQKAAVYIDRYLKGEVVKDSQRARSVNASDIEVSIPESVKKAKRRKMRQLPVAKRLGNFHETTLGFSEAQAVAEAQRCLRCAGRLCWEVCPYEAPQFGAEERAKMQMCDFCPDRLAVNEKPICVAACPVRALDAGPLEELKAKYAAQEEARHFKRSRIAPSVVFKPKLKG